MATREDLAFPPNCRTYAALSLVILLGARRLADGLLDGGQGFHQLSARGPGRLFDRLEEAFTADRIFIDIDNIEPGLDFVRVLEDQVDRCDVLLAVIGPN